MADYWDEHGANEDEYIEDIFDFIRRLNSGQLPSHWHLEDYADLRLPANVVRMLFDNNPGSQRKTSEWFIEAIEENDSFPGKLKKHHLRVSSIAQFYLRKYGYGTWMS